MCGKHAADNCDAAQHKKNTHTTFICTVRIATETKMSRPLWYFVYHAFNRLDGERLRRFGPDRTCAEWILRNGGRVSLSSAPGTLLADYNALPRVAAAVEASQPFRLHSIVAERIGLLAMGFEHLQVGWWVGYYQCLRNNMCACHSAGLHRH